MLSIIAPDKDIRPWLKALHEQAPDIPVSVWPKISEQTTMALCWNAPEGSMSGLQKLGCICSMGAGVDHILQMKDLPAEIPIVRLVDPNLNKDMFNYILECLNRYQNNSGRLKKSLIITVLGLGEIGSYVAQELSNLGYTVRGWRHSQQSVPGIATYFGEALTECVSGTDVLINLLPLTSQTEGILNQELFQCLASKACLINVARGAHLVEDDLLSALSNKWLMEAYLDVFRIEPLPKHHPFRENQNIHITPHIASLTRPESVMPQIIKNYHHLSLNQPLDHQISRKSGY